MTELKLFVDVNDEVENKVIICQSNADKLEVKKGDAIEVINPDNNLKRVARVGISDSMLDFAGQFAKNLLDELQFSGVELTIRKSSAAAQPTPTVKVPSPQPASTPISTSAPQPITRPPPQPIPQPAATPQLTPPPMSIPTPQPGISPLPTPPPQPTPLGIPPSPSAQPTIEPAVPAEPYPDKIDISTLQNQKRGVILKPIIDNSIEGGRVQISATILNQLGLGQGMLIAWEDPLTRSMGSARIDATNITPSEIKMSFDTYEDTNIQAEQVVVYSTEPPIEKASELMLEVDSQPNLMGHALISPRTQ
ncbi:MAG: hypothetical protein ACFFE4_14360, partial [Candidatus Thorarchaeota archaeon]